MKLTLSQYLISITSLAIYVYLLAVGRRRDLLGHFPFFYGFLLWCLVRDLARWGVLFYFGYSSPVYYHFYYTSGFVTPLAQILLLTEIYYQVKSSSDRLHWFFLLGFTGLMSWYSAAQHEREVYLVFNTIALYFQVLFCLLIHLQLHKNRRIYLGRNFSGILYGLSLMISLQACNYGLRLFHYVPHEYFALLLQAMGVIPFAMYVWYMDRLDLPRAIQPEIVDELAAIEANFRRAARSVR
ncbi:MAG: hypothetical protein HY645_00345 [Acidobacteria bacterium]|nr:hypothetical protein [Acidobacteriota bacterium]